MFRVEIFNGAVWNTASEHTRNEDALRQIEIFKAKAISKVVNENPDLYKQYLQGGAN